MYTPLDLKDTITALCTPPGIGGVAIIRISGSKAIEIANKIFSGNVFSYATHTCHFGHIKDSCGRTLDEALLVIMLENRSFTGETTVEIQCHGGRFASKKILELVIQLGARLARPGEFALRSFLNGKMDLTQAEAIQELICAKNEKAFTCASQQLSGTLSQKIKYFQKDLTNLAAILEAWVDFPEEGIVFTTMEQIVSDLENILTEMKHLLATYEEGQRLKEGISLCLIGPPNAGKSSLMNALLKKERAIVTPIAGTTRDLLEDDLVLGGIHFRLIDTAGIRSSLDEIEKEGISRSYRMLEEADLVLLVLDSSQCLTDGDRLLIEKAPKEKTLLIWNKIDLPNTFPIPSCFPFFAKISAKEKKGLDELTSIVAEMVWKGKDLAKEEVILTSMRHKEALTHAIDHCQSVVLGLQRGDSPEFLTFEIRSCLASLGRILGTDITEEILSSIFSQFCIGK